jgi:hypothetical protein
MFNSRRLITHTVCAIAIVVAAGTTACNRTPIRVTSVIVDSAALTQLKTFSLKAPPPVEAEVKRRAIVGDSTHQAAGSVVMEMDPMLATSAVGQAIRQDLTDAFARRGYQSGTGSVDFYVAYYAGTGSVVSTRASEQSYKTTGSKLTTETYEYPAGTIVVDVVDARNNSLIWRGTGLAAIPNNPDDYKRVIQDAVNQIVAQFPHAR